MGPFLITLAFVTILIVTGVIVNMYLYGSGAKSYKRPQSFKHPARRYTTGESMSDTEYYVSLTRVHDEGPRYARYAILLLAIPVILVLIVVVSLLSTLH